VKKTLGAKSRTGRIAGEGCGFEIGRADGKKLIAYNNGSAGRWADSSLAFLAAEVGGIGPANKDQSAPKIAEFESTQTGATYPHFGPSI